MPVSTTRLNDLFRRSLIKKYQDDECGEDAAHHKPLRSSSMDANGNEVSVMGLRGGVYVFRRKVLESGSVTLLSVLKRLPKEIRQSVSTKGIPWIMVRSGESALSSADDETIEHFLLMCMASGFIQSNGGVVGSCRIPFVTMDDMSLVRKEKMKTEGQRAILIRWFA